ncbi:MAG: trehalose-6-phosphate synthase [Terriglobales bacterium]
MTPPRLIVVSNRLPFTLQAGAGGISARPSSGGLVTALTPILRQTGGCWVGWTGTEYAPELDTFVRSYAEAPFSLRPVFLTETEKRYFYHGCSNEILWPLFHDLQSRCNFDPDYWDVYRDVNEKYADAVEAVAHRHDFVWIHDYHLIPLADALHARDLRLSTAYFHHIPFPAPDIFEKLPWRNEILAGLLQFDTVGFQTARDRRNFVASVRRCLRDVHVRNLGPRLLVSAGGFCTRAGTFPISIDSRALEEEAGRPAVAARAAEIRGRFGGEQIILGVDRLDYTKGIPERLIALRLLLRSHSELRGRICLLQVVVPSREEIPAYHDLRLRIEHLVAEINGEFGTAEWTPIRYLYRSIPRDELVAFYRAADVALITPLKDGMNLVAKEYCAARVDDAGCLVLSEFAGAAEELKDGALLVNPYDAHGVATALRRALNMSASEKCARMRRMRLVIRQHDVFAWCRAFCGSAISRMPAAEQPIPVYLVRPVAAHAAAS